MYYITITSTLRNYKCLRRYKYCIQTFDEYGSFITVYYEDKLCTYKDAINAAKQWLHEHSYNAYEFKVIEQIYEESTYHGKSNGIQRAVIKKFEE